jgi:hypothetical protein
MSVKCRLDVRFTFLCSPYERQLLSAIAEHFGRSQGDAVRLLIRQAAREHNLLDSCDPLQMSNATGPNSNYHPS